MPTARFVLSILLINNGPPLSSLTSTTALFGRFSAFMIAFNCVSSATSLRRFSWLFCSHFFTLAVASSYLTRSMTPVPDPYGAVYSNFVRPNHS
jgi:hypothetical protein